VPNNTTNQKKSKLRGSLSTEASPQLKIFITFLPYYAPTLRSGASQGESHADFFFIVFLSEIHQDFISI
jgi:hypothetical protein